MTARVLGWPGAARRPRAGVRARGLGQNTGLALAGDLAAKAAGFLAIAVAARLLPTAEFAVLGVCTALLTVLTAALDGGVGILITRDGARDAAARGAILRASLVARAPLLAAALTAAIALGVARGRPAEALVTVAGAAAGAVAITVLGCFRAAQDLAVEARQKLAAGLLGLGAAVALAAWRPTAWAVLAGLAIGPLLTLPPLLRRARGVTAGGMRRPATEVARAAAPLAGMGLATLAYYRAPTVLLGVWAPVADTAAFTLAATLAFGLLALPNAITTGLLPRLAALPDGAARRAAAAAALRWSVAVTAFVSAALAAVAPWALPRVFGASFAGAHVPLLVLLAAGILIAASGVIGTLLVAEGRMRPLAAQVVACLGANLMLAGALIPSAGATGAALATLATEVLALLMLAGEVWRPDRAALRAWAGAHLRAAAPGAIVARLGVLRLSVLTGLGGLLAMWAWATATDYGLRVISDAPSYLAIVRGLAIEPWQSISPFLPSDGVATSHATPYTQGLALLWDNLAAVHDAAGRPLADPVGLARFLAVVGLVVTGLLLHAAFVWARRHAGSRAAWICLPVLLGLFGPAHVIWAGDLSFHAALYAPYVPQTLAMALLLYTLVVLERAPRPWTLAAAAALAAATLVAHPFTGVLLCLLLTTRGAWLAVRRDPAWAAGSVCLLAGFLVARLWPLYPLERALGETGVDGSIFIGACAALPALARALPAPRRLGAAGARLLRRVDGSPALLGALAAAGTLTVIALAAWELWLFTQPNPDPLVNSNRLSLYWVEDRWRWPLMLASGTVGLMGLARLARRGRIVPAAWLAGCLAVGVAGAAGLPAPVWWRFLLFCQLPLALGTAVVIAEARPGLLRRVVVGTLCATLVFKVATLVGVSDRITYFATPLQDAYALGDIIPPGDGLVASDPFTSYFIPAGGDHRVLVVTKAHVGSAAELAASEDGYRLLHRMYMGRDWWEAAREMYRRGVRYVVIEKSTSLRPPTLERFSTGPTPLIRTEADRRLLGVYYYRNNRVGDLIYDQRPYSVYRLDPRRLGLGAAG